MFVASPRNILSLLGFSGVLFPVFQVIAVAAQADTLSVPAPRWTVFSGMAPVGSSVSLDSTTTVTDSSGHWRLAVPLDSVTRSAGTVSLCLSQNNQRACVPVHPAGYDSLELAPLRFTENAPAPQDSLANADSLRRDSTARREVERKAVLLDAGKPGGRTVVVQGKRRPKVLGQEHVTAQQIKRMPGLAEPDVIRAVQALPGVVSSSDFSTKVYVRGSPSDENLVLYDNAVVYSPAHFGGLFSTFLADGIGGLDFYKGGFDPRYGNRLASVLAVHGKEGGSTFDSTNRLAGTKLGDSAKVEGTVRLTTFSGSAETDGRRGDWSWTLAGRRTWIDQALSLANDLKLTNFNLNYFFYDWQGDWAWGHNGDTVKVSLYQGRDKLSINNLLLDWGNLAVPLNIHKRLTSDLSYDGTVAWSTFDQTFDLTANRSFDNSIKTLNVRQDLEYKGFLGHTLTGGYEYNRFWVSFAQYLQSQNQYLEDRYALGLHAAYAQDRWVITPRHTVTLGLRAYDYPTLQDDAKSASYRLQNLGEYFQADPRFTYTYRPNRDYRYDFHMGYYHQFLTSLRLADQETFNEFWYAVKGNMQPSASALTAVGVERSNWTRWGLTAAWEGYYKDMRGIPLFDPNSTVSLDSNQRNRMDLSQFFTRLNGYAVGSEITLKREEGAISGEASYALSAVVLKQLPSASSPIDTVFKPYYADWDQRHTFKLALNLNWKGDQGAIWQPARKGRYFRSSLQFNFHSGLPYTGLGLYDHVHDAFRGDYGGVPGASPRIGTVADEINSANRPPYARLDITPVDVGREGHWRFYWTIINLTNRKNVFLTTIERNTNPPTQTYFYQFPFLPIFMGYEYEF